MAYRHVGIIGQIWVLFLTFWVTMRREIAGNKAVFLVRITWPWPGFSWVLSAFCSIFACIVVYRDLLLYCLRVFLFRFFFYNVIGWDRFACGVLWVACSVTVWYSSAKSFLVACSEALNSAYYSARFLSVYCLACLATLYLACCSACYWRIELACSWKIFACLWYYSGSK